jgi:hypothetical protein
MSACRWVRFAVLTVVGVILARHAKVSIALIRVMWDVIMGSMNAQPLRGVRQHLDFAVKSLKMFTHIDINLTEPICTCNPDSLIWQFIVEKPRSATSSGNRLLIECTSCGVSLLVPNSQLLARFKLNAPKLALPLPKVEPKPLAKILKLFKTEKEDLTNKNG